MAQRTEQGIFERIVGDLEVGQVLDAAVRDLRATARHGYRELQADLRRVRRLGAGESDDATSAAVSMFEQVGPAGAAVSAVNVLSEVAEKPKPFELFGLTLEVLGACFLVVPGGRAATLLGRCFIGAGFTRDALAVLRPGSPPGPPPASGPEKNLAAR